MKDLTVQRIWNVFRLKNSPVGQTVHRRDRERWALILKTEGQTIYSAAGETVLSDATHPVLLPRGCSYSWECTHPGECIVIEFEAEEQQTEILSFSIADNSLIRNSFQKIEKNLDLSPLECKFRLYEILRFLHRSDRKEYISKEKMQRLKPAMERMTAFYFDPSLTNDALAALCGISTVYFRKLFEEVYGISPIKYLHNLRIRKAKAMLRSDYDSIGQVAESVGYGDIYHFSKMFRIYTGQSPSEYAKASR